MKWLNIFLSWFLLILLIVFYSCKHYKSEKEDDAFTKRNDVEYKLYKTGNGWGYDILINNKKYIHQPTIPSIGGLKSFYTKEKAQKTAEFVCSKIKRKIMPPSVTPKELDSLGVLN